jgi:hypothetical protein
MILNIDFDGTVVTHEYPRVGKDIGAVPVLKRLVENGHQLILFTMRGDNSHLKEAVDWFKINDIPLYGINTNPTQISWTDSPKSHADLILDDTALGTPLLFNWSVSTHPYVDWVKMEELLIQRGLL